MHVSRRVSLLVALPLAFGAGPAALLAQTPPSATFRPQLLETLETSYSYSSRERLEDGIQELAVHRAELSLAGRHALSEEMLLLLGVGVSWFDLDSTPSQFSVGALLPDSLGEVSLNLGLTYRLDERWSFAGFVRPGFYGDLDEIDGDLFNAPVLLLANYTVSPTLTWNFGVSANPFSDNVVLPVAGVRWQFAPDWTLNVGFPRSGVTWAWTEQLEFDAGVSVQGGSFHTSDDGRLGPNIRDTKLDYREIRVGVGAAWKLTPALKLRVDAGSFVDREFDYHERNVKIETDSGFYGTLALEARF